MTCMQTGICSRDLSNTYSSNMFFNHAYAHNVQELIYLHLFTELFRFENT